MVENTNFRVKVFFLLGTRRWSSSVAQDMLCLLSLWFKYAGKMDSVHSLLEVIFENCGVLTFYIKVLGCLLEWIAKQRRRGAPR